jgi:hypothetical protein
MLLTVRGQRYVVECKSFLQQTNWIALQRIAGDGTPRQLIEPLSDPAQAFFRVRQIP